MSHLVSHLTTPLVSRFVSHLTTPRVSHLVSHFTTPLASPQQVVPGRVYAPGAWEAYYVEPTG